MKVRELIEKLEGLNKPDAEITLLGNVGNPEDDETDLYFDNLEIWDDGEETITLFVGLSKETFSKIIGMDITDNNDDDDDIDYYSGLLYGVDNNQ
jgi:hypothetical protein